MSLQKRQIGWIEHTLANIAGAIERAVFTEEHTRKAGVLQQLDPRVKLIMFLMLVLAAGLAHSLWVLIGVYTVLLLVAWSSRIPFEFFVRRVWMGIPLFAGIVILPAVFFTTGERLFDVHLGVVHFGPSIASLYTGAVFITRVAVSVSLAVLLVLTTPWADILKSLQALRVPEVFILVLAMTYRYIFLFLHTANGLFEARRSRVVGISSVHEQRRWISGAMVSLLNRSFKMSNEVYAAMAARGFNGVLRVYSVYRMRGKDWLALACALGLVVLIVLLERFVA